MTHDGRIFFRTDQRLVDAVTEKAQSVSMTVPEYMRHILRRDLKVKL